MTEPARTLRLRLDRGALAANWRALDRLSGDAAAGAAVKANAYGLGVEGVVPVLAAAGARQFFVAHLSEVAGVIAHVPPAQVAVLHGVNSAQEAAFARDTGVRPVLNSLHQIRLWRDAGGGACMVMVDSGINRLGLPPGDCGDPLLAGLEVELLLSHLASADEDTPQNAAQLALFRDVSANFPGVRRSLANSAGIALGPEFHFDLTRPGLALYGGVPCDRLGGHIAQVAFPEAAVLQVRSLAAGEHVGYNATFTAPAAMRVATVSIGYADGLLRQWAGRIALQHDGAALPVLGRVSMDMVVVDASAAPALREGDFCVIPYALPASAKASGLSQYELLTLLGHRFARL